MAPAIGIYEPQRPHLKAVRPTLPLGRRRPGRDGEVSCSAFSSLFAVTLGPASYFLTVTVKGEKNLQFKL